MIGTLILVLLILLLIAGLPTWGYSREWGYRPASIIGIILVIYLFFVLIGTIPLGTEPVEPTTINTQPVS